MVSVVRWLTPQGATLRSAWDGSRRWAAKRVERNDHDPLARVRRLDRPLERVLDLGRGEIEHAGHAAASSPRPADASPGAAAP